MQTQDLSEHTLVKNSQEDLQIETQESDPQDQRSNAEKEQLGTLVRDNASFVPGFHEDEQALRFLPIQSPSLAYFLDNLPAVAMISQLLDNEGGEFFVHIGSSP